LAAGHQYAQFNSYDDSDFSERSIQTPHHRYWLRLPSNSSSNLHTHDRHTRAQLDDDRAQHELKTQADFICRLLIIITRER
jgi:hypothetical protein